MKIRKSRGVLFVLFWVVLLTAGCSSSGGGDDSTLLPTGYDTYTTADSDLVLQIPWTLDVSQEEIERIHYYAGLVDHCTTTSRDAIDIVLAEACIYYDTYYLFPEYFPRNLDSILNVSAYVGYLRNYDIFTYYFSPENFTEVMAAYSGNSAFIGLSVSCSGETIGIETPLVISDIEPYTRAWIDGFQVGDSILQIGGVFIAGMTPDEAGLLFPTNEAEAIEITIERDGVEIMILTAAEENIGLILYDDIAYLNARSFTEITGEEIRQDYEDLQTAAAGNIDKIILDLRDNGGGAHDGMVELIDYLIDMDDGSYPILSRSGPAVEEETEYLGDYCDVNIGDYDETNFVLLIDENSASASEIVAAALKYYGTAYLIGETTYGKGIGQFIVELIDGSGVVIPAINTLPPSGISYHGIGVTPDYYYSPPVTSFDDDPVLDAAVDYLRSGSIISADSVQAIQETEKSISEYSMDPLYEKLLMKNRRGGYY